MLEWDPVELATADLISLSLYRNGQKAGNIPRPLQMHSTKISGLAVDTEYTFHLVLRTTAGTYASTPPVAVRTHKMTDLSGVTITAGVLSPAQRDDLARAVARVGAKIVDGVRIDTTHFVTAEGRGLAWEKAVEMNIPVVRPEWVDACERSGRILGVTKFYLDAVRPGPGDEDVRRESTSTSTAAAAAATTPGPAPADKQLPERPVENGGSDNDETTTNEAKKKKKKDEGSVSGDSEEEDESGDDDDEKPTAAGEKTKSAAEGEDKIKAASEQKVRLEDKDTQRLAVQPGEPAIRDPNEEEDAKQGGGSATSPGDGASFQDVAL